MSAIKNESTDELLRQILPSLAVQIRIPLGNMYSTLQRLLRRYPATGEELAPFYQSYYRMLRLAGNLSDAQELTSEEPLPLANEDIVAFVHQICLQAETPAELCGQRIIFQSSKSAHIMAFHPSSIERLLLNLLSNSMKFSGKGCLITVSVTVRRDTVELTVEDTGPGLDPAVPLFTPYLPPGPRDSSPRGQGLGPWATAGTSWSPACPTLGPRSPSPCRTSGPPTASCGIPSWTTPAASTTPWWSSPTPCPPPPSFPLSWTTEGDLSAYPVKFDKTSVAFSRKTWYDTNVHFIAHRSI